MPELPEVEVVKRSLESSILNLSVKAVKIKETNLRFKVKKHEINQIIDLKVLKIKRRSKYILFFFTKNVVMIAHLGMTGKFFLVKKKVKEKTSFYYNLDDKKDLKHDHLVITFRNKTKLIYNDVRKFGFIKVTKLDKLKENEHLKTLGPEPLNDAFSLKYFKDYIKGRNKIIKDLLMDQKFVSGLGNIYVNEILFYSHIHPARKISQLKENEIKRILINSKKILQKAINFGGSSIKNFSNSEGKIGTFQQYFTVYGKIGKNCSNSDCNGEIEKLILSNRGSFFCPKCQK